MQKADGITNGESFVNTEAFVNAELGIEATIAAFHKGGFSVAIKDTDAGEYFPMAKVFKTLEEAKTFAKKAVA